ncbi:unnamed protein product, partial [Prorocentrum cordatum]
SALGSFERELLEAIGGQLRGFSDRIDQVEEKRGGPRLRFCGGLPCHSGVARPGGVFGERAGACLLCAEQIPLPGLACGAAQDGGSASWGAARDDASPVQGCGRGPWQRLGGCFSGPTGPNRASGAAPQWGADLDLGALVEAGGRDAGRAIPLAMLQALEKGSWPSTARVDAAAFTELGCDAAGASWSVALCDVQRIRFGRFEDRGRLWEMLASLRALRRSRQCDLLGARIGQFLKAKQQSVTASGYWRVAWAVVGAPGPRPGVDQEAAGRARPA